MKPLQLAVIGFGTLGRACSAVVKQDLIQAVSDSPFLPPVHPHRRNIKKLQFHMLRSHERPGQGGNPRAHLISHEAPSRCKQGRYLLKELGTGRHAHGGKRNT